MGIKAFISQSVCKVCVGAVVRWGGEDGRGRETFTLGFSLSRTVISFFLVFS